MGYYFDNRQSAAWLVGNEPEKIIRLMAAKYMGDHPVSPYVWRTWNKDGIQSNRKAGYLFDFGERFPEGNIGEIVYALGDLYCPMEKDSGFLIRCFSPVCVWLNGEQVFSSSGEQERNGHPVRFDVSLKEGYNRFLFRCERTSIGFGCIFQNAMPQWEPCNYILPFSDREGEAGFLFTAPMLEDELNPAVCFDETEAATGITWLPASDHHEVSETGCFYAWTAYASDKEYVCTQDIKIVLIDGKEPESAPILPAGKHSLLLYEQMHCVYMNAGELQLISPIPAHGYSTPYLLLGPCEISKEPETLLRGGVIYEDTTWRRILKHTAAPYVEVPLFGRWTYPLGILIRPVNLRQTAK